VGFANFTRRGERDWQIEIRAVWGRDRDEAEVQISRTVFLFPKHPWSNSVFAMKRIKDWGSVTVSLLAIAFVLRASAQAPAAARNSTAKATEHHSLWKIEGKNAAVYLLGSIHVLRPEDYPLAEQIDKAFTNSETVAFETDVAALDDPALAMKMLGKMQLPEGETLETQLSPEVYKDFQKHAKDSGAPDFMLQKLKPTMAAMMIEVMELTKLGLQPDKGIDKHFFGIAKEAGKTIVPLETVDFQLNLLTEFTKEEGEAMMKATLKDLENIKKDLGDLIAAWKTGDSAGLDKMLNDMKQDAPAVYKRLVTDRSRNWLPKIEEMTKGDKTAIVIVGAAHLVGKEGVVQLLQDKGYKVTQL
jgi:uncharacterized protein